jgi:hypothetical protein
MAVGFSNCVFGQTIRALGTSEAAHYRFAYVLAYLSDEIGSSDGYAAYPD